jgi:hypothetical protein
MNISLIVILLHQPYTLAEKAASEIADILHPAEQMEVTIVYNTQTG